MGAIIMRRSALSEGRTAWYRRSVCRRERPSRPFGPGSSVIGTVTYLLWRSWLGCELSLPAPTSSGSELSLENGSGACGVNLSTGELRALSGASEPPAHPGYHHC